MRRPIDRRPVGVDDAHCHRAIYRLAVLDHVDESSLWTVLHGDRRDDNLAPPHIGDESNVDELFGKQEAVAILEHGLDAYRSRWFDQSGCPL